MLFRNLKVYNKRNKSTKIFWCNLRKLWKLNLDEAIRTRGEEVNDDSQVTLFII